MVSGSGSYNDVMLHCCIQPCSCRPGVNLPVEVEGHRTVLKSWAAMHLSSIFLLSIFIGEKDLPETFSLQRELMRNTMCFQMGHKMYSLINLLSLSSLSEVSSRKKRWKELRNKFSLFTTTKTIRVLRKAETQRLERWRTDSFTIMLCSCTPQVLFSLYCQIFNVCG